jgi:hypothetical protein
MNNGLHTTPTKLTRLLACAALTTAGLLGAAYPGAARADSGPYFITYPGYCNVKQLYIDNQGTVYGKEVGCEVTLGEPMVGVFSSDGVHVARTSRSNGLPCVETYWYDGSLSGVCSDGSYVYYEPTLYYGPQAQRLPGTAAQPPRIAWKQVPQMPDLNTLRNLPPTSR